VLAEDGSAFGTATAGFEPDKHLVLNDWYGDLATTAAAL
jgi:hypothetical protein